MKEEKWAQDLARDRKRPKLDWSCQTKMSVYIRLWKPMVEEIHMLETRQSQKASPKDKNANKSSDHLSSANSLASENPSTSTQRVQDIPSKFTRSEFPDIPMRSEPLNLSYNSLSSHPHVVVGVSNWESRTRGKRKGILMKKKEQNVRRGGRFS